MGTIAKALITSSVAVWAAGCSGPPTARVDAAKARVAALAAEAHTWPGRVPAGRVSPQVAITMNSSGWASRSRSRRPRNGIF